MILYINIEESGVRTVVELVSSIYFNIPNNSDIQRANSRTCHRFHTSSYCYDFFVISNTTMIFWHLGLVRWCDLDYHNYCFRDIVYSWYSLLRYIPVYINPGFLFIATLEILGLGPGPICTASTTVLAVVQYWLREVPGLPVLLTIHLTTS